MREKVKTFKRYRRKIRVTHLGNYPGTFAYRNKKNNSDRGTKQAKCTAHRKLNLQFFLLVRTWHVFRTSVVAEHNFSTFDICVDNLSFNGDVTEAIFPPKTATQIE